MKRIAILALVLGCAAAGALALASTVPDLRWRSDVLMMKLEGDVIDLSWGELLPMLMPGSPYYLEKMAETGNPYSTISNPYDTDADGQAGRELYESHCIQCHGRDGAGNSAPALNSGDLKHGNSDWWLYRVITRGIPGTGMVGRDLDERDAWQIVSYLRDIEVRDLRIDPSASGPHPALADVRPVGAERLLSATETPDDWLTYSGSYDGHRHSSLSQINRDNAASLRVDWVHQVDIADGFFETSPVVNDGVMYVTVPPSDVHALDAATGETLWTYTRRVPRQLPLCCGEVNRGVAVLGNAVYFGTVDAHLIALDSASGTLLWEATLGDYRTGYTTTVAPLAVGNKIVMGISGGEYGIRGFLDAYDAATGERVWRFYTIPGDGEPGNETWEGDSWRTGGAPTWLTGAYDADENLVYWGVGNPGPVYQGDFRQGDNLYSNSVVALDADTGELRWHFQFTPHDVHDWDANQVPVLVDRPWRGKPRKLMLWANRNGFFYVLDRVTGEFLLAEAFVKQNWALSIDAAGRPVEDPAAAPTPQGSVSYPSPLGATNWQSPTFHRGLDLLFVPVIDGGRVVYKEAGEVEYVPGHAFWGSLHQMISNEHPLQTGVRAIAPDTGRIVWESMHAPRLKWWKPGGLLSTAGDIVFGGDHRAFFVLDARTGETLWQMNAGGYINANPVTYSVNGRQRIAMAAGRALFTFGLPDAAN